MQRVGARQTMVFVQRILVSSTHSSLISHPNVVSLLSTKDTKSNTNSNSSNDDHSQNTGRKTGNSSSRESFSTSGSITITNTTFIQISARNGFQVATRDWVALSNRTVTRGRAFYWYIGTTNKGGTSIIGAQVTIITGDRSMHTSSGWVATVNSAVVLVITVYCDDKRLKLAAINRITRVMSACIVVIASRDWCRVAVTIGSKCRITEVICAGITIITSYRLRGACASIRITDNSCARSSRRAGNCRAVARSYWIKSTTSGRDTIISCARIRISTWSFRWESATNSSVTVIICASIVVVTSHS
jgi:hypothetical protein